MSDAIAKPSKRKGPDPREDAFLRFINRVMSWTQENLRAVVAGGVLLVLAGGAGLWYVSYQQNLEQEAAVQLRAVESAFASGADTIGVERLQSFLAQYGDTEAARQARMLLARLQLRRGDAEQAIEAVGAAAERPPDTPEGYAARMLLAKAQEAAGRREAALKTLQRLADGARFGFQRREAAAKRAEILVEMGRLADAEAIYQRLVEQASGDASSQQQLYAVRLGEVRAMRAAEGSASSGGGTGSRAAGDGEAS